MISIFRTVKEKDVIYNDSLENIIRRIRFGENKKKINLIRSEKDKTKKAVLKNSLPVYYFAGTFLSQKAKDIQEPSGLLCLDIDKIGTFEEVEKVKEELAKDEFVNVAFISPSGDGLKLIIKIPKDPENYSRYYEALAEYFDGLPVDLKSKDLARACFDSYDPKIHYNPDSLTWHKLKEQEVITYQPERKGIPIDDDDKKISMIVGWWESKNTLNEGERNSNLFKLCASFNDYGVSITHASQFINYNYGNIGLSHDELNSIIRSAYSNYTNFGSKQIKDYEKVKKATQYFQRGFEPSTVKEKLIKEGIEEDEAEKVIDLADKETNIKVFYEKEENKKGQQIIKIIPDKFKLWLQKNGFYKYYPQEGKDPIIIRIQNNIVNESSYVDIKDFTLKSLEKSGEFDVWNFCANKTNLFSANYLNMIDSIDLEITRDTEKEAYLFYKNKVVIVDKGSIKEKDYTDFDGFIWRKQILNRDFKEHINNYGQFQQFISCVSDGKPERFLSLCSVIGYLCHTYKSKEHQKAIILNDEIISDNPDGRSGKSLFLVALTHVRNLVTINGKSFDPNKSNFTYQRINNETQLIAFDDVKKNFNFEDLFSLITQGLEVERKGKDAVFICFEESPKIIITTNYVINGTGGSHLARRFEVEFSPYFNANHTPLDEFGNLLFDDWDSEEWQRFDSFIIHCIQLFLKKGLVKYETINADEKRFIQETTKDFYDWVSDSNISINQELSSGSIKDNFINEYGNYKDLSTRKFCVMG
jgi:hypothetical protein